MEANKTGGSDQERLTARRWNKEVCSSRLAGMVSGSRTGLEVSSGIEMISFIHRSALNNYGTMEKKIVLRTKVSFSAGFFISEGLAAHCTRGSSKA